MLTSFIITPRISAPRTLCDHLTILSLWHAFSQQQHNARPCKRSQNPYGHQGSWIWQKIECSQSRTDLWCAWNYPPQQNGWCETNHRTTTKKSTSGWIGGASPYSAYSWPRWVRVFSPAKGYWRYSQKYPRVASWTSDRQALGTPTCKTHSRAKNAFFAFLWLPEGPMRRA